MKPLKPREPDMDYIRLKDPYIKGLLGSLKLKSTYKIDPTLKPELDTYLTVSKDLKGKIRRIPYGINGPEDLKTIGLLFSRCQAYKDRVREIDLLFLDFIASFKVLKKTAVEHIWNNYGNEISNLKPVARQQIFIDSVLSEIDDFMFQCEQVRERTTIILANLTDSYWTLDKVSTIAQAFMPRDIARGVRQV
jgi:hypothetical protein